MFLNKIQFLTNNLLSDHLSPPLYYFFITMTEKNQDRLEQNKRINELTRKVGRLEEQVNTLNNAIEPDGWISQAFDKVEEHLIEQDRRIDKLDQNMNHNFAELRSSLNHIVDHLTKLSDLPEE